MSKATKKTAKIVHRVPKPKVTWIGSRGAVICGDSHLPDTERVFRDTLDKLSNRKNGEGRADLMATDPPFNICRDYCGDGGKSDDLPFPEYIDLIQQSVLWYGIRPAREGAAVYVHLPDKPVAHLFVRMEQLMADGCQLTHENWITLHQQFGQNTFEKFIPSKVHGLHYTVGNRKDRTWNVDEILEPSERLKMGDKRTVHSPFGGRRPFLDCWMGQFLGRVQGNNAERRPVHDNQLPEMYVARIIRPLSNRGDIVVDPYGGSGTVPMVADALGRKFITIEKYAENAKSLIERIHKGPVRRVQGTLVANY